MWRIKDRLRRWVREFRKRHDNGVKLKKTYVGGSGGAEPKEEAKWSWRSGWKGKRGAENGAASVVSAAEEEARWPGLALGSGDDGILSPPPPIPKPPRNSVVMERLAEVLGASSTETSFGFRRRDYLRQAEEKDTLPKNRRYAHEKRGGVHEKHKKMQDKVGKDRTSGPWKRGVEKFKRLKSLVSPERRTTYSASRPATPRIAIKTKIVDTSLLHPHWKGRHLVSGGHPPSESRAGTLPSTSHTRSKGQPASQTQPPAMDVPEMTTPTTTVNPNDEHIDEELMVAPPTFVDSIHNISHGGSERVPSWTLGVGKGKEIDYKLYHEDSIFKAQTPGFSPPRQGFKERCDCNRCNPLQIASSPSDRYYRHPHCEGNHDNPISLPSSQVDANEFSQGYTSQSLANGGTADAPMLIGSMRSTGLPAQIPSSPMNLDDYSGMDIDTSEPPMRLPSWLRTDTYALPSVVPTIAFSQVPEFTTYTIGAYTGGNLPGTFEESAVRFRPTSSSYRTGGTLEEHNDIMFVKTRNDKKQPRDFVEREDGSSNVIKGEKAYNYSKKGHEVSEKSIENPSKPMSCSQTPTKTPSPISTNTYAHLKTHPKPSRQQHEISRPQTSLSTKNDLHPLQRRRSLGNEEDQTLTMTTTRRPGHQVYDHHQGRHSEENETREHEKEQRDETPDSSGRVPSYVGTGQRPPKLFFTRPRPRALVSSASASALVSAALPSPVPEEEGTGNNDDSREHGSQVHDPEAHDNREKTHRHSHHSHTNRYSKSSSNSNNRRSSRSSWSLSISTISTRASSPHSHSSRRKKHSSSKRHSESSANKSDRKKSNRHSTGSINDIPHAGPSTWYKTTPGESRKRSSTASTTGTTATGSSRVSSLDKITTNDSISSLKTHVHTYSRSQSHTHSHTHSRTRSDMTTGTVDSQATQDTRDSHDSNDTGSGEGRNRLRHTRTASVQVDSDLLIIPLEEVEDYVLPLSSDSSVQSPSDAASDAEGHEHARRDDGGESHGNEHGQRIRRPRLDEEYHRGSWEWERSPRDTPKTGYVRGDAGGGGWRIVNGADGNHVRVRVKEVRGEGTDISTSATTSSRTGLWMKDSRGTIGSTGTVRTIGTEGTEMMEVRSYGSYGSVD